MFPPVFIIHIFFVVVAVENAAFNGLFIISFLPTCRSQYWTNFFVVHVSSFAHCCVSSYKKVNMSCYIWTKMLSANYHHHHHLYAFHSLRTESKMRDDMHWTWRTHKTRIVECHEHVNSQIKYSDSPLFSCSRWLRWYVHISKMNRADFQIFTILSPMAALDMYRYFSWGWRGKQNERERESQPMSDYFHLNIFRLSVSLEDWYHHQTNTKP